MIREINLELLEQLNACDDGIKAFKAEFDDKTVDIIDIINVAINSKDLDNLEYANWLVCRCFNRQQVLQYAIYAAKHVLPIFEAEYPNDNRPRLAIEATEAVLLNDNDENRKKAKAAAEAAWVAAWAAEAAKAARVAWVAWATARAAEAAAEAAARVAAWAAEATDNEIETYKLFLQKAIEIINKD